MQKNTEIYSKRSVNTYDLQSMVNRAVEEKEFNQYFSAPTTGPKLLERMNESGLMKQIFNVKKDELNPQDMKEIITHVRTKSTKYSGDRLNKYDLESAVQLAEYIKRESFFKYCSTNRQSMYDSGLMQKFFPDKGNTNIHDDVDLIKQHVTNDLAELKDIVEKAIAEKKEEIFSQFSEYCTNNLESMKQSGELETIFPGQNKDRLDSREDINAVMNFVQTNTYPRFKIPEMQLNISYLERTVNQALDAKEKEILAEFRGYWNEKKSLMEESGLINEIFGNQPPEDGPYSYIDSSDLKKIIQHVQDKTQKTFMEVDITDLTTIVDAALSKKEEPISIRSDSSVKNDLPVLETPSSSVKDDLPELETPVTTRLEDNDNVTIGDDSAAPVEKEPEQQHPVYNSTHADLKKPTNANTSSLFHTQTVTQNTTHNTHEKKPLLHVFHHAFKEFKQRFKQADIVQKKHKILEQVEEKIKSFENISALNQFKQDIKKTDDYNVLAQGQGALTQRGLRTSGSLKALEKLFDAKEHELNHPVTPQHK